MNVCYLIAGVFCVLLGAAHSVIGEILIFQKMRKGGRTIPTKVSTDLREKQLRIIWATWHLASIFGWLIGWLIIQLSKKDELVNDIFELRLIIGVAIAMFISSMLVCWATKGKHPGWVVLGVIGILLVIGSIQ